MKALHHDNPEFNERIGLFGTFLYTTLRSKKGPQNIQYTNKFQLLDKAEMEELERVCVDLTDDLKKRVSYTINYCLEVDLQHNMIILFSFLNF